MDTPPELNPFYDDDGRLRQWPARRRLQLVALAWLAKHFEPKREYAEPEVNELLEDLHSFADAAMLRRALFDHRFLDRERDGSRYRRREPPPA